MVLQHAGCKMVRVRVRVLRKVMENNWNGLTPSTPVGLCSLPNKFVMILSDFGIRDKDASKALVNVSTETPQRE